jgi:hypothetical protein
MANWGSITGGPLSDKLKNSTSFNPEPAASGQVYFTPADFLF